MTRGHHLHAHPNPGRWLLTERPASRMQARLGAPPQHVAALLFNQLAIIGLAIIVVSPWWRRSPT